MKTPLLIILGIAAALLIGGCGLTNPNANPIPQRTGRGAFYTGIYPSAATIEGSDYTQLQANQKCDAAWQHFKDELLTGESSGAVAWDEPDTVVSEGQSYGMMLALQNNDQATFDHIWYWTKTYLQPAQPQGLFCWKAQTNGTPIEEDAAADADEMIALALIMASNRWGDKTGIYNYSAQAEEVLARILTAEVTDDNYFMASPTTAQLFNPSYLMPAFYKMFEEFTGESRWRQTAENTFVLINRCLKSSLGNTENGLVPDWCDKNGNPGPSGMSGIFSYDAMRVPYYIALDEIWFGEDDYARAYLGRIITNFFGPAYDSFGSEYNLNGTKTASEYEISYLGSFTGGAMGATNEADKVNFFNALMATPFATGAYKYYDICWHNFGLLLSSGNFRIY